MQTGVKWPRTVARIGAAASLGVCLSVVPASAQSLPVTPPKVPQLPATPQLPKAPVPAPAPTLPAPPPVQVPSAPKAPAPGPTPSVPKVPYVGATGGSGGSSGGGGVSGGSSPPRDGSGTAYGPGTGPNSSSGEGSRNGKEQARKRRRSKRRKRFERRLRRTVRRNTDCLSSLGNFQQRVLRLRTGVGDRPSRSRRAVARRLDVRGKRVARAESRGLKRLRRAADSGCGETRGSIPLAWFMPVSPLAIATPMPQLTELASLSPGGTSRSVGGVLGAFRSSDGDGGLDFGPGAEGPDGAGGSTLGLQLDGADGSAGDGLTATQLASETDDGLATGPVLVLALLGLTALGAYAVLLRSRRRQTPAASAAGGGTATAAAALAEKPLHAPIEEPERPAADTREPTSSERSEAPWLASPPAATKGSQTSVASAGVGGATPGAAASPTAGAQASPAPARKTQRPRLRRITGAAGAVTSTVSSAAARVTAKGRRKRPGGGR